MRRGKGKVKGNNKCWIKLISCMAEMNAKESTRVKNTCQVEIYARLGHDIQVRDSLDWAFRERER